MLPAGDEVDDGWTTGGARGGRGSTMSSTVPMANRFLALLALVALVLALVALVAIVRRRVPDWLADSALPLATAIAAVATAGSLFYSEVAGYPPCTLCWYQRIAMYPLVVVVGVAAVRRDRTVWLPASILAGIGGAISVWHLVIERNPVLGGACDPSNPCAILWVQEFGFLTIPAMALIGFLTIGLLTGAAAVAARRMADDVTTPEDDVATP
jgi:disulfide bond formation protein DsbB